MSIDISEFLNPDFTTAEYYPIDEDIAEISDSVKEAWKQIYGFAYTLNQKGRKFNSTDIQNQAELYCGVIHGLTTAKIESVFKKVFTQNKEEFGIADKPEWVKVEVFLRRHWEFIYNEVTQVTEFRAKGNHEWADINHDTIFRRLQSVGFKFGLDKVKSITRSDFVPAYNPFVHYFNSLTPWDQQADHISDLASYVTVTDNDFFQSQFKKALVRNIACSLFGVENRIVFTLIGEKQSTGKSTFIRFLSPFGNKYYTEAPIRNNKDAEFSFAENFIYNLEELSSLSNLDINRLKSIISMTSIKERKAYAVNAVQLPRRCNFWGSSNKKQFLTDTENTRWLVFELIGINWDYKKNVDINKVWAQAFSLFMSGFSYQLTADEAKRRDDTNKSYEVEGVEKDLIMQSFEVTIKGDGEYFPNSTILETLQAGASTKLNSRLIGTTMAQLGFIPDEKKINGHKSRGWWAKYIPEVDRNYKEVEDNRKF